MLNKLIEKQYKIDFKGLNIVIKQKYNKIIF